MTEKIEYSAPTDIGIAYEQTQGAEWTNTHYITVDNARTIYPRWSSSYNSYQIQRRVRGRFRPNTPPNTPGFDSNEYECWSEWSEWASYSTTIVNKGTGAARTNYSAGRTPRYMYSFNGDAAGEDDIRYQDMEQWEFRVRAFAAKSGYDAVSEWAYGTIDIVYVPDITGITASVDKDMNLKIGIQFGANHQWQRPFSISSSKGFWFYGASTTSLSYAYMKVVDDNRSRINILDVEIEDGIAKTGITKVGSVDMFSNRYYADWNKFLQSVEESNVSIVTDGASVPFNEIDVPLSLSGESSTVPEPVISVTTDEVSSVITVTVTGSFDDVDILSTYTDYRGEIHTNNVEVKRGDAWVQMIVDVPYDTPVTISAIGYTSNGWKGATYDSSVTIPSKGRWTWVTWQKNIDSGIYDVSHVSLLFDTEPSYTYSLEGETIKLAGRETPVSRYGMGGQRTIKLSGRAFNPNMAQARQAQHLFYESDFWWNDLIKLTEPHNWTLKRPGGLIHTVQITDFDHSEPKDNINVFMNVSISMVEVG